MPGRRFYGLLILAAVLGCLLARVGAQTQIARPSKFRTIRRDSRMLSSHISLPVRAGESQLPAAASPDIIWVQCPAEAIVLDPAVTCGYLPVPMHRERPEQTEKIKIYFEVYPHTNAGQAESAILVNGGGRV
jgi:hypothetical protein